ncbi:diaminopimelate decarboxylase [Lacihabitans lacunae]|uniref:Diaminopimelate decarboxylase n=1 Tax=Lacihabitans lacunae TaxID=1028214 RepID=A0ABV7YUX7_9BACT
MHLANNQYVIQNTPVLDLCNEFETPLYVYDGSKIEEKVNILKSTFSDVNMKIKYACKANTNISVLKLMKTLGVELDVVSPQEIQLGLKAGFSPKQITFTSSGVSFDEIENSVENDVLVNIDNLPTLEKFGEKYGNTVPVMLRIRPNVVGGGNLKIMTGHKDSKFGIAIEQKDQILALVNKYNLDVVGLHQHTGSDIKDGQTFVDAAKVMLELAFSFPDLKYMDFGGGFKVSYKEGDAITDMAGLGKILTQEFKTFCTKYGKELELWFEPGKFLVSECGYLFAEANVVKENPTFTLIGLNTGLNHLIRPMMYDAYHEVINVSKPTQAKDTEYNVVGYICETDDFAKNRMMPSADQGDVFCFLNAGAYGFTMASNYNSRFKPAEVLIYKEKVHLVRARETMEDILKNQILVEL